MENLTEDKFKKKLLYLFKSIKQYIDKQINEKNKNNKKQLRTKKTNILDAVAYRITYNQNNNTLDNSCNIVNDFKNNNNIEYNIKNNIDEFNNPSRQSYDDRAKQIPKKFFYNLLKYTDNKINDIFYDDDNIDINNINDLKFEDYTNTNIKTENKTNILAVDGTYVQLIKKTNKDGCILNKNNNSTTCLATCIFNVSNQQPSELELEISNKDERKSFLNLLKNIKTKRDIYTFDRGYHSLQLITEIHKSENYFLCRLQKNSGYINHTNLNNNYSEIIKIKNKYGNLNKVRIIKYTINDKKYFMVTNLYNENEYTIEKIKDIYHKRWDIEEYFKYLKKTTNLKNINERTFNKIKESTYIMVFLSKFIYLIKSFYEILYEKSRNPEIKKKIVNKTNLFNTCILKKLFLKILYNNNKNELITFKFLNDFLHASIKYIKDNKNIKGIRKCMRSTYLSYYKEFNIIDK
jgi:hypothetical protein